MKKLVSVLDELNTLGISPELLMTEYAGHATELARSVAGQGGVTIVAAGGDGTISEVVAGMLGTDARLGIIPLGTANVLAREFNIPQKTKVIARILATTGGRVLWPGRLEYASGESRVFIQMASAGFDASVVHAVRSGIKKHIGRYAYVLAAIMTLFRYKSDNVSVEIDGKHFFSKGVIVSKGQFYAGHYVLTRQANPSVQGFTVVMFDRFSCLYLLQVGYKLLRGRLDELRGVKTIHAKQIKILAPRGVPLQADGDAALAAPVTLNDVEASILIATL